ncbi:lytic transglycosylase domain-containing protein [Sulfitobacter sp. R18_1]|uniref:lytic transglycosylase domain-containing protein n=1 Tax=Sulfitobacter sp. R18_1 TaxID=2821104 RepID=UPI001FFE03A2|nr:lytic transglycosylase domain-containing protein [Sulfitobacter sp. R18_1]
MLIPVTTACIIAAASTFNIDPLIIAGIMKTEGGKVGRYSTNSNGTLDLGPMQINDGVWIDEVANTFFLGDENMARQKLLNDGCFNIKAGAWILRQNIDLSDGNVLEGIGRYHSWTPKHKTRYQSKFMENYNNMMSRNP